MESDWHLLCRWLQDGEVKTGAVDDWMMVDILRAAVRHLWDSDLEVTGAVEFTELDMSVLVIS